MNTKKVVSLVLGISGAGLSIFSITQMRMITGAVVGTNSTSKMLGFVGIGLMMIAVFIERYKRPNKK